MPLLKGRLYPPVKPLSDQKPNEPTFTIQHTKETFRSKEEYEKRLKLYQEDVWTCQCTGHINLTHKEAVRSEEKIYATLKTEFDAIFEKPVLELVHHSIEQLDHLVDKTWRRIHQELCIDEPVALRVMQGGKNVEGTIVRVDKCGLEESSESSNCSSPSSNKENSGDKQSPKKFSMPKLLAYKYSVKLNDGEKIINGIPSTDLIREVRVPPKELVKFFIRGYAVRSNYTTNSPWVVKDDLVAKYKLTSKFADFFLSPTKMSELGKKAMEESKKRRKSGVKSTKLNGKGPGRKPSINPKKKLSLNSSVKERKTSPLKAAQNVVELSSDSDSESSDDVTLAELSKSPVKSSKSPTKTPKSITSTPSKSEQTSPGTPGSKKRGRPRMTDEEKAAAKAARVALKLEEGDTPAKSSEKGEKGEKSAKKKLPVTPAGSPKKRGRPRKDESQTNTPKKKMKQATLFDMKGKSPSKASPAVNKKSPGRPKSPTKLPPIATRLKKEFKKGGLKECTRLITICSKQLNLSQISCLPDELQKPVRLKYDKIQEKKQLEKMTEEEKETYFKKKKEDAKKKLREYMRKKWRENNKRFEDTDLDLSKLPNPKIVPTPDGFVNELFGDVAMVTEFINCFKDLLLPESDSSHTLISTESLMTGLVRGSDGAAVLAQVLAILLQTLLQDDMASEYRELEIPMSQIPVTPNTTSELVRLCLRKHDGEVDHRDDSSTDSEDSDETNDEELEAVLEQLGCCEVFELSCQDKLRVLQVLCDRILNSYCVQDHMDARQHTATELWKKRTADLKEKNDRLKEKKQKDREAGVLKRGPRKKDEEQRELPKGVTLVNFYGKAANEEAEEEAADLATVVKRRRLMAAKAVEDKKQKEIDDRNWREEQRKIQDRENFEKEFNDGILAARLTLRQSPVGTDRNHDRYWLFHKTTPGLYVEKGWAGIESDYCTMSKKQLKKLEESSSESDTGCETDASETNQSSKKKKRRTRKKLLHDEKTAPHASQNLWFFYDNMEDIDNLIDSLHPMGVRESALRASLKSLYDMLVQSVRAVHRPRPTPPECLTSAAGFKQELQDMELRLRNGGLGGVDGFEKWENELEKATTVEDCGDCLLETQCHVLDKFVKGRMAIMEKKRKVKKPEIKDEAENKDVKEEVKEEKEEDELVAVGVEMWRAAVNECTTWSRLHVLMGMMDSCIKWEKSAENAKCKICRKKGEEEKLLLCDDCNQAFHLYCLRPALAAIPQTEWFCPACTPLSQRRAARNKNYRVLAGESSEAESESAESETSENPESMVDLNCEVCGGDEDVYACSTCDSSFHLDCHEPPLRREPRSSWRCMQCVSGVRIRPRRSSKRFLQQERAAKKRKRAGYSDDEDFCLHPPSKRACTSRTVRPRYKEQGSSDEEEEEEEEEYDTPRKNRHTAGRKRGGAANHTPPKPRGRPGRKAPASVSPASSEHGTRRSGSAKFDLVNGDITAANVDKARHVILDIIHRLKRHKKSWPFHLPVTKDEVPDYHEVVKMPIDLQTIEDRCVSEQYTSDPQAFVDDICLLFDNAALYNKPDSLVGACIPPVEKIFTDVLHKKFPHLIYDRDPDSNQKTNHSNSFNGIQSDSSENNSVLDDHAYFSPKK